MMTRFEKIDLKRTVRGKCATCGKKTTRTISAYQTLNPLNKNAEGEPKTVAEIQRENSAEIQAESEKPLFCAAHR